MAPKGRICPELAADGQSTLSQGAGSRLVLTSPQFSGLQWESSQVSFENVLHHKPQIGKESKKTLSHVQ